MKKLFFFPRPEKKTALRSNEWMNMWTFPGKKKQKKCQNFRKKKTTHFVKNYVKPVKFWMNGVWTFPGKKKNKLVFFFPAWQKKIKNSIVGFELNEWMTDELFQRKYKIGNVWHHAYDYYRDSTTKRHRLKRSHCSGTSLFIQTLSFDKTSVDRCYNLVPRK